MLLTRAGASPIMVGRDAEHERLRQLAAEAADGPRVAIVSGESGVGKTRLLLELMAEAPGLVLAGGVEEADGGAPFALMRRLLDDAVSAWDDAVPAPLRPRERALRRALSPSLTQDAAAAAQTVTTDEQVRAVVEAVAWLVARGDQPALLVLDDLHWTDAESLQVWQRLAARSELRALLVGAFRPEDLDRSHPLAATLPTLQRQQAVADLALDRLDRHALARLLAAALREPIDARTLHAVHERTRGNPFFVEELIACCGDGGVAALAEAELPWNAAEAVLRRLDSLDPEARAVLDAAAPLGLRVPFDLLAAVAGRDEADLVTHVRTLIAQGLLVEAEPDVLLFRHALTREAVARQLLARQRRATHRAALDALEAAGSADVIALARHARGAEDAARLVPAARQASARCLAEGSGGQALELAELALEAPWLDDRDALALHGLAARACWLLGERTTGSRHTRAWQQLARDLGQPLEEAAAWRTEARLHQLAPDRPAARDAIDRALAVAEPVGDSHELAWALATRAQVHMLSEEADEAIAWAKRAVAVADRIGADAVRLGAQVTIGTVLTELPGRADEGLALLEDAAHRADAAREGTTLVRALNNAMVAVALGQPEGSARGRRLLRRLEHVADRYGLDHMTRTTRWARAWLAQVEGDQEALAEAVGGALADDSPQRRTDRALLAIERDALDAAAADLAGAEPGLEDADAAHARWAGVAALLALRRGDAATASQRLDDVAAHHPGERERDEEHGGRPMTVRSGDPRHRTLALLDAVLVGVAADSAHRVAADTARRVAAVLRALPSAEHPWGQEHAELADGAVAALEGADEAALARLTGALARIEEQALPVSALTRAVSWELVARVRARAGDRAGAITGADHAAAALRRWPGWRRERVLALAERLRGRTGDEGPLTAREREVLAHLAQGRTNGQIAQALFISRKTASVHVSNILAKTGTASRTEAAAWAHRVGLVPPVGSTGDAARDAGGGTPSDQGLGPSISRQGTPSSP